MKELKLINQNLTKLTESDLIQFCELNNIKPNELEKLNLKNNYFTDLNFITEKTSFVNLKIFYISNNWYKININNIQYLSNLEILDIDNLHLKSKKETIKILKIMKNLKVLRCHNYTFKTYTKEQLQKELPNIKNILK